MIALAALAVPLAVHLLNRAPGKPRPIGSTLLLQPSVTNRLRRLKLRDPWLLLLRTTLIALLVLSLAQPLLQSEEPAGAIPQIHVLVIPGTELDDPVQGLLDSLESAGGVLHWLAPGFPAFERNPAGHEAIAPDYWSLLAEFDANNPENEPLYVLGQPGMQGLVGQRPMLRRPVTWISAPRTPTPARWVASARMLTRDTIRVVSGRSDSLSTRFVVSYLDRRAPESVEGGWTAIDSGDGSTWLRIAGESGAAPVQSAAAPPAVAIRFDSDRRQDARYLEAAIRSASSHLDLPISLSSGVTTLPVESPVEILVWLSNAPPSDVDCSIQVVDGALPYTAARATATTPNGRAIPIHRRTHLPDMPIGRWLDGHGEPVLGVNPQPRRTTYALASRFHPAWGRVVTDAALPELVLELLMRTQPPEHDSAAIASDRLDVRIAGLAQAQPDTGRRAPAQTEKSADSTPLLPLLWGCAAVLFVVERTYAIRSRK